jgi:hypothetical protein
MFKIQANPTIDAKLTLIGQGREQVLELTFKHSTRSDYLQLLSDVREEKRKPEDALASLIEKWNADMAVSADAMKALDEHQPGALMAILNAYGDALVVARKGN